MTKNRMTGSVVLSCLLAGLAHCSGVTQPIGDAPGGAAGTSGADQAAGSAQAGTEQAGGAAPTAGAGASAGSAQACSGNQVVVLSKDRSLIRCVAPCDGAEQSEWGQPCANAFPGTEGVCRPFNRWLSSGSTTGIGICTRNCDPMARDCPTGYSCDLSETLASAAPDRVFTCLPSFFPEPAAEGSACNGFPVGDCGVGLTCYSDTAQPACRVLCDPAASNACPAGKACTKPDYFPPDSAIGVCL